MPCNSDYLNPEQREIELQKTAVLLVRTLRLLGRKADAKLLRASRDCYCNVDYVSELCATITNMTKEEREEIVYDSHSVISRQLADWWERHQQADRERKQDEREEARLQKIREVALSKLTLAEIRALGIQD